MSAISFSDVVLCSPMFYMFEKVGGGLAKRSVIDIPRAQVIRNQRVVVGISPIVGDKGSGACYSLVRTSLALFH